MAEDNPVCAQAHHSNNRLIHLDGLRGVAAIGVMFFHVNIIYCINTGLERGYLFVDLFFILSGFVLNLAWASSFGRGISPEALMTTRLRRLWPMIAAGALIGAVVHALLGDVEDISSLLCLALLLVPLTGKSGLIYPLNGSQWSMLWELIANLIHVSWLRKGNKLHLTAIVVIMALCIIMGIAKFGSNTFGPNSDIWWLAFARVGWSYSIGMLIAHQYQTMGSRRQGMIWWKPLLLILLTVLLIPRLPTSTALGDILVVIFIFPALFSLMATARQSIKAERVLTKLGSLSFPLYAIHLPLLEFFAALNMPRVVAAALAVMLSLLLSAIFCYTIERRRDCKKQTDILQGSQTEMQPVVTFD